MMSFNLRNRSCGITAFARVASKVSLASMSSTINKPVPPSSTYDGIVCDMDGVLWRGQEEIPRSIDALNVLKLRGKSVVFVTNNSATTRHAVSKRLLSLGYDAKPSDIITSSSVTADYLKNTLRNKDISDIDDVPKYPIKVFMIGNPALREELEASDFQVLSVPDTEPANLDQEEFTQLQQSLDAEIRAVVVGVDSSFTFRKLSISGLYLQNKRCLFVATNPDNGNRISNGGMHPETGSLAAAVQSLSGIKPTICGKPSHIIVDYVMKQLQNSNPDRLLMVGDRLDTDIAFANAAHFPSCLVFSGVTLEGEVQGKSNSLHRSQTPSYLAQDLWDMVSPVSEEDLKTLDVIKSKQMS